MESRKKLLAFTLAEVLITLAIIGVVAAMTIPILMQNYQKSQYLTALKKVYSQLTDVVDRVMVDENLDSLYDSTLIKGSDADHKAFFKKYFRVSKYCAPADYKSCVAEPIAINKGGPYFPSTGSTCVILKDGASVCLDPGMVEIDHKVGFYVDTNGLDKPNIGGRDVFYFDAYANGSLDEIDPDELADGTITRDDRKAICEVSPYGFGCFSRIIDSGWKMDY